MNFFSRIKAAASAAVTAMKGLPVLSGVDSNRGWITLFRGNKDSTWQSDTKLSHDDVIAFSPVYACITLIASDIGKLCLRLMKQENSIWMEASSPAFSPLLRKPNHFQTRQQFIECWILSKVSSGNAYVLKVRDNRKVVVALYVLDTNRVVPLVAPDGSVYYQLLRDDLSKVWDDMPAIPASEIIHDRMECLFHPLVGVSPLIAAYMPATQGMRIQQNSETFFKNMSRPSGFLTAPGTINDETAARLKDQWEKNYSGGNIGRLAVLGDNLKYEAASVKPIDAQLVDQLKLSAEQICSAFHVPPYMVGVGELPSYNNVEALNQQYYNQCLQKLFNAIEDLLDDGLGLAPLGYRTEFDLDDLLRMDTAAQYKSLTEAVGGCLMVPNEGRRRLNLPPKNGGDELYMQQQNYSLSALAKRDAKDDPFETSGGQSTPKPAPPAEPDPDASSDIEAREYIQYILKGLECEQT